MLFVILGTIASLAFLVCHILVAVHAFRDSLLTGLLYVFIPCYSLYFLFFRFEHENKLLYVVWWFLGASIGSALTSYGYREMAAPHHGGAHHRAAVAAVVAPSV